MSIQDYAHLTAGKQVKYLNKWGGNPDVGTGAFEDLWAAGGLYPWPTTASAVRIKAGGNAADDADGGDNARTVVVVGLDQNWNEATETLTLAGADASDPSTTTFARVFRAYVDTVGVYGNTNAGVIDIETTGGTTLAEILAGQGQTELALWTVPAGFTAFVTRLRINVNGGKSATVRFKIRANANNTTTPSAIRVISEWDEFDGATSFEADPPYQFPAYTDMWLDAKADGGAATAVYAEFDAYIVETE
jgi:hypothetical protein